MTWEACVQKETGFLAYGMPNEAAKQALAPLQPTYEASIDGFIR